MGTHICTPHLQTNHRIFNIGIQLSVLFVRRIVTKIDSGDDGTTELNFDLMLRVYNILRLLNNIYNTTLGASLWLPSLLSAIVTLLPMLIYAIVKLRDELDLISYGFCFVGVPCSCVLLFWFYSPMESIFSVSAYLSAPSQIHRIILEHKSKGEANMRQNYNKMKVRYIQGLFKSLKPLQCKIYSFGFIDRNAMATLFKVIFDLTVYLLLTF